MAYNQPPSSRVNYGDHYLVAAIKAHINKIAPPVTVNKLLHGQNARGLVEKQNLSVSTYTKGGR